MKDTRPRVKMNICFPSQKEKEEAIAKATKKGKTVSQIIQEYFRRLK